MKKNIKLRLKPFKIYHHGFDWMGEVFYALNQYNAVEIYFNSKPWIKVKEIKYTIRKEDKPGTVMAIVMIVPNDRRQNQYHHDWYFSEPISYEEEY